jgi:hypothetical protein
LAVFVAKSTVCKAKSSEIGHGKTALTAKAANIFQNVLLLC